MAKFRFSAVGSLFSDRLPDYTNYIIDKFEIRKKTQTNRSVTKLTYNEDINLWYVEVATGQSYTARFIIDTSGVLANPHIPHIEGAESFQGAKFHSGQWDHSVSYAGKRVGIIGSGCSAAQIVPAIAKQVSQLTLFMGKAQWVIPRSDRNYSFPERFLMNLPVIRQLNRFIIFAYHEVRFVAFRHYPYTQKISHLIKKLYAKTLKKNLKKYIKEDKLREHMTPNYELGSRSLSENMSCSEGKLI